ncbi:hypothetical protein [Ancylobacter mangrovi]|uniref:hypothetical protein n=1 Tax=Ancylobacter mangrovi TaxID=2972472 RepID=UPI0021625B35|nr:hypothetical protein [Ancylobacter mangrovi]MCS0501401.1 hypothetical protein [Ancylobacter mangrovi]
MEKSEQRARAQCELDARRVGIQAIAIPGLVERLWPAVAIQMNGGAVDPGGPTPPSDIVDRVEEFRLLLGWDDPDAHARTALVR